jgi:cytochrome c-type biogenesis protein CcmH
MSEKVRSAVAVGVSAVAFAFILLGLSSGPSAEASPEDRIESLSASIRCPFCNGESLADSQANVAADYRSLIAEQVEAGMTDEEIIDEFAANFGDSFILDTSTSPWSIALWVIPVTALLIGTLVVVMMKRKAASNEVRDV